MFGQQTAAQLAVLRNAKRVVVKVGSSLVTNDGKGIDEHAIAHWARQLAALVGQGREVIMVSSGAVAEGMKRRHRAKHQPVLASRRGRRERYLQAAQTFS